MTDDAFLKAILADPDDDTHRLVYADWLEENGGEAELARAEFIRVQVEADRLKKGKARTALERRARALLKANPAWERPITEPGLGSKPVFRRGFLHQVTLPAFRFVRVADELFAAAPTVRSVIFPTPLNEIDDLVACPALARLTEADLSQFCQCGACAIDVQIRAVFACKYAANLTRLRVSGNRIDEEGARALAASKHLKRLRELDLSQNELGNAGARVLLEAKWLGALTRLDVRENEIGVRAASALRKRFGDVVVV